MKGQSAWIIALACALPAAGVGGAQQVSGSFEATNVTITPTHVCAYPVRASWDPGEEGIAVMLSEGPVDAAAAVEALVPHTQAINQDSLDGKNYITVYIWPDGTVAINATKSEGMVQYIDDTDMQLVAELVTNTAEEVGGRIWTEEPVKLRDGESYTVDLSFATTITRPAPGEALGQGGGEPGEVMMALVAATRAGNWPSMKSSLPEDFFGRTYCNFESEEPTDAEALECALESLPDWITSSEQEIEILGGEDRGETAVLEVRQKHSAGFAMLNLVRMNKRQAGWVYDSYAMVGVY